MCSSDLSLVLKIWKETGKTIILITHSVEEALLLGEKVYVMAFGGTSFGDNSSHYCVGAGTIPGKGVEMGHCIIKFINGDTAITYYEIKLGYSMDGTFKCISGTGRYEGIECSGTTGYTQMKTALEGKVHSTNYLKGTYTLKK